MHDFIAFLLDLLRTSLGMMLLAALLCGLGIAIAAFLRKRAGKSAKPGSRKRVVLIVCLVMYLALLCYVTLLRRGNGFHSLNLHLFRAWREAWNRFSLKNWLNVLLNVALFLPFGFLPPLIWNRMRKWYAVILLGIALSLLIEVLQYRCGLGVADVDDLFCNGLGTALGYCFAMTLLHLKEKRFKQMLPYLTLPAVCAASILCMGLIYTLQDYGNLSLAASYRINTKGFTWETETALSENNLQAIVYRAPSMDQRSCDAFGAAFFEQIGEEINDTYYYDDSTLFANHSSGHFLFVNEQDGTYTYSNTISNSETDAVPLTEETVRAALDPFAVEIPEQAVFLSEGNCRYRFEMKQVSVPGGMYDGEIDCILSPEGEVCDIKNYLQFYETQDTVTILSEQQAYETIRNGWITHPMLEDLHQPHILIHGVALEYRIDTKGFYQPVYVFSVSVNGTPLENGLLVPAL